MQKEMPPIAAAYVQTINTGKRESFDSLFAENAIVHDAGHTYKGAASIKIWSDREIFDAHVTLDTIDFIDRDHQIMITTNVDGDFDRTGLPDPVVIEHSLKTNDGKIVELTCKLAEQTSTH